MGCCIVPPELVPGMMYIDPVDTIPCPEVDVSENQSESGAARSQAAEPYSSELISAELHWSCDHDGQVDQELQASTAQLDCTNPKPEEGKRASLS